MDAWCLPLPLPRKHSVRIGLPALLCCAIVLAGCSGPGLPFAKEEPAKGGAEDMVKPPWEAYVQAGPGAENDIDLETLNGPVTGPMQPVTPSVEGQPAKLPDPPPPPPEPATDGKIHYAAVPTVTGADATGAGELTQAMRTILRESGWPVLDKARKDALVIQGKVSISAPHNGNQVVKLVWSVSTPAGENLGDIKQENTVPAGALDGGWGENAQFAAEAAAEGIFKLIQKFR